jgi:CheY-like chemotaxis protein
MDVRRWSVVIVTPNRFEGRLIVDALKGAGAMRVRAVPDSDVALEQVAHELTSAVIVDLDAIPRDGLTWVRTMRRDQQNRSRAAPVFLLARALTPTVAEACRHAGANAVIGLPVSTATLLNTITRVRAKPRPFVEADGYVGPCRRAGIVTAGAGSRRRTSDKDH